MQHSNAGNRLDRLSIASFHKKILIVISFAYFFEFADINSFSAMVPQLMKTWGITVNVVAYITLSFLGMFFGSTIGGWLIVLAGKKR